MRDIPCCPLKRASAGSRPSPPAGAKEGGKHQSVVFTSFSIIYAGGGMPSLHVSETGLDGFGFLLVAGFGEESKHVALVVLDSGLVEGVHVENVAAYAAGFLEEVD